MSEKNFKNDCQAVPSFGSYFAFSLSLVFIDHLLSVTMFNY